MLNHRSSQILHSMRRFHSKLNRKQSLATIKNRRHRKRWLLWANQADKDQSWSPLKPKLVPMGKSKTPETTSFTQQMLATKAEPIKSRTKRKILETELNLCKSQVTKSKHPKNTNRKEMFSSQTQPFQGQLLKWFQPTTRVRMLMTRLPTATWVQSR